MSGFTIGEEAGWNRAYSRYVVAPGLRESIRPWAFLDAWGFLVWLWYKETTHDASRE
jgi:hypothetical protein